MARASSMRGFSEARDSEREGWGWSEAGGEDSEVEVSDGEGDGLDGEGDGRLEEA